MTNQMSNKNALNHQKYVSMTQTQVTRPVAFTPPPNIPTNMFFRCRPYAFRVQQMRSFNYIK